MGDPFKVFAVDDDPIILNIIREIAEPECTVEVFGSAEDCLSRLGEARPDMFLLDVGLPGINGIDALARLRQLAPKTAIVILTVFEDDDKIFRAICASTSRTFS